MIGIAVKVRDTESKSWAVLDSCFDKITKATDRAGVLHDLYTYLSEYFKDFVVTLTEGDRTFTYTSYKLATMFV